MSGKDKKLVERDSSGKFVEGHTVQGMPSELRELRKKSRSSFMKKIISFGNMPHAQFLTFAENLDKLSPLDQALVTFWMSFSRNPKLDHMKFFSSYILGIPEVKAMAVSDMDSNLLGESEDENKARELNNLGLNKQEKLDLLDKYKKIIEDES